ncbi:hypothetical protein GCM10022204_08800 [Microlunatus aurantiacus]|uniref:EcsC protein family protein n=1 Tax=Microlunatus aurantiacus TaxID=446786 RepID=A0ABP7CX51_9ACTN
MAGEHGVSNEVLQSSLGWYAGLVSRVLNDPSRWLGVDDARPQRVPGLPGRLLRGARRKVLGDVNPTSPQWASRPVAFRTRWWTSRIAASAGLAAAAPRFAGALADRVPLQAALGASAAGLAVCAVAREHGVTDPKDWVPLLSQVLFHRPLAAGGSVPADAVPDEARADEHLEATAADPTEPPSGLAAVGEIVQRTVRTLWGLARALLDVQGLLDERPRGGFVARRLSALPVVGVAGGWLDERGGIRRAAKTTARLVQR